MTHYSPEDGKWLVGPKAILIHELRERMSVEEYERNKMALRKFLCGYFSAGECQTSQGSSICPVRATKRGGKVLKVRWAFPGGGKSGGLRLVVVAYCEQRRVVIANALPRRDDPTDQDIQDSVQDM